MIYLQKKSVAEIPPVSGSVSDTLNVTDKVTNAPSIRLVQEMIDDIPGGGSTEGDSSVPPGGTTGQVLTKNSDTDEDVSWKDNISLNGILTDTVIGWDGEEIPEGYEEVSEEEINVNTNSSDGTPIGSGMDYFGTVAPKNYMFADGSAISRTEYSELFAIIGTIYGEGDGSTTFNLPDKRSRVSVMKNDSGTFDTLGKTVGEETHTLTVNEMPAHKHTFKSGTSSGATSGYGVVAKSGSSSLTLDVYSGYKALTDAMLNTGGGQAHNNIQPSLVCNYIIKVK